MILNMNTLFMPGQKRQHSKNRRMYLFTYLFNDAVIFQDYIASMADE